MGGTVGSGDRQRPTRAPQAVPEPYTDDTDDANKATPISEASKISLDEGTWDFSFDDDVPLVFVRNPSPPPRLFEKPEPVEISAIDLEALDDPEPDKPEKDSPRGSESGVLERSGPKVLDRDPELKILESKPPALEFEEPEPAPEESETVDSAPVLIDTPEPRPAPEIPLFSPVSFEMLAQVPGYQGSILVDSETGEPFCVDSIAFAMGLEFLTVEAALWRDLLLRSAPEVVDEMIAITDTQIWVSRALEPSGRLFIIVFCSRSESTSLARIRLALQASA